MLVYAVIETGGKQVRVKEGDTVRVERLAAAPGDEVTLNRILLIGNGKTEIGAPVVAGAMVREGRRWHIRRVADRPATDGTVRASGWASRSLPGSASPPGR